MKPKSDYQKLESLLYPHSDIYAALCLWFHEQLKSGKEIMFSYPFGFKVDAFVDSNSFVDTLRLDSLYFMRKGLDGYDVNLTTVVHELGKNNSHHIRGYFPRLILLPTGKYDFKVYKHDNKISLTCLKYDEEMRSSFEDTLKRELVRPEDLHKRMIDEIVIHCAKHNLLVALKEFKINVPQLPAEELWDWFHKEGKYLMPAFEDVQEFLEAQIKIKNLPDKTSGVMSRHGSLRGMSDARLSGRIHIFAYSRYKQLILDLINS